MTSRFEAGAAAALRAAIREAGGVEVFAIGDVQDGRVVAVTVTCRGTEDRVPALLDRPRAGQVVIHNHPSGLLEPSEADLSLAHRYGEDGVGVVIVDSQVTRSTWVVEPYVRARVPVDDSALEAFFVDALPRALPGFEPRPQQLEMARAVAASLDREEPLLCEAGTGTGKSLAYLVPAALWALANDSKVVISTFTRALQAQLVGSDLPLLARGGIDARTAVLQGRNNYLCRRRLALAATEEDPPEGIAALEAWSESTRDGSRNDLPFAVDGAIWERVLSDADLTLSVRCPHYVACHYYRARRATAAAHVVIVNHALLLTDLALRGEVGRGFLPKYERVVLDEAHHLEDAATGVATERVSAQAIARAASTLLDAPRRKGALSRLRDLHARPGSALTPDASKDLEIRVEVAAMALNGLSAGSSVTLSHVADVLLPQEESCRLTEPVIASGPWREEMLPTLRHLAGELEQAAEALDAVESLFQDLVLPEEQAQPLLDLRRGRRRLLAHSQVVRSFVEPPDDRCRWTEADRERRGERTAALCAAPVEVSRVLQRILWEPLPGTVATSATLTVAGRFEHWIRRTGLDREHTARQWPSPFDHFQQAVLGLPRDLPPPDHPDFALASESVVVDAVRLSDGGAFVLCTSHQAVRAYGERLRKDAGDRPILVQGEIGRTTLLERFRENRRAVLVGTDSFWEGVSVRGDGLRLVIIPRMPFRVPTEPLLQERHERIARRGGDPFRTYALPEAVLKLRQGYGRLIRSHTDRGAVLLLDRRVHDKSYGQVVLRSLPPARRITGPWRAVSLQLAAFFAGSRST